MKRKKAKEKRQARKRIRLEIVALTLAIIRELIGLVRDMID